MWFTHLSGQALTNENAYDVAVSVGGYVLHDSHGESAVVVETNRGDILITQGDMVGKDQSGRMSVIRFTPEKLEKKANSKVKVTPLDVKRKK